MKRRHFLKATATAGSFGTGGCTQIGESGVSPTKSAIDTQSNNPWEKDTLTVTLEQRVPARHDINEIIQEALDYWVENARIFAGYDISFRYRPNNDNPDIQMILASEIQQCGEHSGEYAWCASTESPPRRTEIRIVDGYRKEWMVATVQHELGHALGLDHDDEPLNIMSNEIEDRIPDYQDRKQAIQLYSDAFESYSNGNEQWSTGVDAWSEEDYSETGRSMNRASEFFLETRDLVDSAAQIVDDVGEERAYELLNEPYLNADRRKKAADAGIEMALAAQRRDFDEAERYREQTNDHLEEADTFEFNRYEDFLIALGFPTKN